MLKRTIIVVSLMLVFVVGLEPAQSVHSRLMTKAEVAELDRLDALATETAGHSASPGENSGKRGNAFVRVVTAPFKAIGRLFGRGKNDKKLRRLSEKDVKKFETAKVARVTDARLVNPEPASDQEAQSAQPNSAPESTGNPGVETNEALLNSLRANVGSDKEPRALLHLERGRVFLNNLQLNQAIAELSLAASLDPKLKEAHNLLGVAYEQKGLKDLALQSFKLALRGNNDEPQHLNNMGFLLFKNGDYSGAVKYLTRASKLAPDDQRIWNNLGLAQAQRGKFDDAYKSFARAVGEFEGHMNIATRLERLGRHKEAIKHLEQARALKPNSLDVLARLINLYDRTDRPQDAQDARTAFLSIQATATAPTQ